MLPFLDHGFVIMWLHPSLLGFVWMWPLVGYTSWCQYTCFTPLSTPCDVDMLALLALCHPFGFPCFCAFSLHAFLHVHACVCVLSIIQSNGTMDIWSKPTFVLLGHPLLFDNTFLCLFVFLTFFAPIWHLFLACLLACFPSILFFACLLACFLACCTYMHGAKTLGVRAWPPRRKQNG